MLQASTGQSNPLQAFWEEHPLIAVFAEAMKEGHWITHVFEWIFMYISKLAAYIMTFAVGYMIFYAIESKHALDAVIAHPQFPDILASVSSEIINVAPELVFPGVVVLCIRSFTACKWFDGSCWLITSIIFAVLTMTLLNAFMSGGIDKDFLSAMLFWRAGAALFYTVVVALCGASQGLDFKTLLRELAEIRVQLDTKNQEVSSVQSRLKSVQSQVSSLQEEVSSGQKIVSSLRVQLDSEQKKVSSLEDQLDTGHGDLSGIRRELNGAKIEMESLSLQLDTKNREVDDLKKMLESGQDWRVSNLEKQLQAERERVSSIEKLLEKERAQVSSLRVQLDTRPSSSVQSQVSSGHPTGRAKLDTGHPNMVNTGQSNVVQLDTSRRKTGQDEKVIEEQIRALLIAEPGLSGRAIASKIGCSPTTGAKWKTTIEEEQQAIVNG
jgi:hypothetical protein